LKLSLLISGLLIFGSFLRLAAQQAPIDRCNVVWNGASRDASGSMPCGGGDIGLNVWVENGDLLFYFARSGSFDENNAFLKGGRIRIRLQPNPLEGVVRQELVLRDGAVVVSGRTRGAAVKIRVWVDVFRPAVHVDMDGSRPLDAEVTYESWRTANRALSGKENNANSYKWGARHAPGGRVVTRRDSIAFALGGVEFFHRNEGETVFDVTVHQQGLDSVRSRLRDPLRGLTFGGLLSGTDMVPGGTTSGRYLDTDFRGWRLVSRRAAKDRHVLLVLETGQVASAAAWELRLKAALADVQANQRTARETTRQWWAAFWKRSFIYIGDSASPQWQVGRNYQLFRYMLGCNAYGSEPTKFNGGLFTYDPSLVDSSYRFTPDFRNWGGGTMTAQNQRLVYWPMLRSGDFDLMKPQFQFYLRSLKTAELRSRVYWGHDGACFTEQLENFGLPNSAEYGWDMPADHDKGVQYNAWLEYEWDTSLEFCLMMLETKSYSGANIDAYIPFIESCLRFFDEHYRYLAALRGRRALDGDGHLILYPGSAGETYKMAYDASSTIAGLHTVLTRLLELPAGTLSDSSRVYFTDMLHRLPPLSFRSFGGHPTIAPARVWERVNNKESMQLYPVFPWGVYGIGRPGLDTAINTYKYDTDAVRFRSYIGWKQDNIFAARLGLTAEAASLTVKKLADGPRRFPAFWGPGFDWTPDHNWGGSGMIGLQEMLLQTTGKKIYLFPAWPAAWDVHFKLYAPYATTVEAELRAGKLVLLKVSPEERRGDIINVLQ
jgi:hypothetical protein